jgi:adenylate kinase family enzyme
MINLVLFGKPGAGKGTQAEFLKSKYQLFHLSPQEICLDIISLTKQHWEHWHNPIWTKGIWFPIR